MTENSRNNLETKVSLLERDYERFMVLVEKLDVNMSKITELATSLKQILAVQENRLNNNDDKYETLESRVDKHSQRLDILEQWRWYLTGAVVIVGFTLPIILNYFKR